MQETEGAQAEAQAERAAKDALTDELNSSKVRIATLEDQAAVAATRQAASDGDGTVLRERVRGLEAQAQALEEQVAHLQDDARQVCSLESCQDR